MDWIDTYLKYTKGTPTPSIFRLWSAITAVSGAVERRVWVETGKGKLYPNLYTLLVGPPGSGKSQAIKPVKELLDGSERAESCSRITLPKRRSLTSYRRMPDGLSKMTLRMALLSTTPLSYLVLSSGFSCPNTIWTLSKSSITYTTIPKITEKSGVLWKDVTQTLQTHRLSCLLELSLTSSLPFFPKKPGAWVFALASSWSMLQKHLSLSYSEEA